MRMTIESPHTILVGELSEEAKAQVVRAVRVDLLEHFWTEDTRRSLLRDSGGGTLPWVGTLSGFKRPPTRGATLEALLDAIVRPILDHPYEDRTELGDARDIYDIHTRIDSLLIAIGAICVLAGHNPICDERILNGLRSTLEKILAGP